MTNSASIGGKRRMLVTFDQYNKDMLLRTLDRYLQQGYMLSCAHGFFGVLTFEPLPPAQPWEGVKYTVVQHTLYTDRPQPEGWKDCGGIGDYAVYRCDSRAATAEFPQPDKTLEAVERENRNRGTFLGLLWFMQLIMRIDMSDGSGDDLVIILALIINTVGYTYKGCRRINRHCTKRGITAVCSVVHYNSPVSCGHFIMGHYKSVKIFTRRVFPTGEKFFIFFSGKLLTFEQ